MKKKVSLILTTNFSFTCTCGYGAIFCKRGILSDCICCWCLFDDNLFCCCCCWIKWCWWWYCCECICDDNGGDGVGINGAVCGASGNDCGGGGGGCTCWDTAYVARMMRNLFKKKWKIKWN